MFMMTVDINVEKKCIKEVEKAEKSKWSVMATKGAVTENSHKSQLIRTCTLLAFLCVCVQLHGKMQLYVYVYVCNNGPR